MLQDQATVASDQAALASAKLNLSYCRITSPVDGSVGLRQVDIGNVVSAYSSTIVVVTQLHPMSVLFTIPEDDLSQVTGRMGQSNKLQAVAYDRTFTTKLDTGVLADIDNEVDPTTGTLKLRAMFNNMTMQLFPQQFVNVRLTIETLQNQILVPAAAVQNGASGSYVYVVDAGIAPAAVDDPPGAAASGAPGFAGRRGRRGGGRRFGGAADFGGGGPAHTVHLRYVSTGPSVGDLTSIRSGLSVGETVVVDGVEQLKDGALVTTPGLDQPAAAAGQLGAAAPAAAPDAAPQAASAPYGGTGARAHLGTGSRRKGSHAANPSAPQS